MSTQDNMPDGRGALDGLRIADFSRVLAGPYATMLLADLGADVVKIERPGVGDDTRAWRPPADHEGTSTYYLSVNRNKRSAVLDLATEAGREQARALVAECDVVVENFRPGTMERLGLGHEELRARHPELIYCSISGFGSGAGAAIPGYDLLVQAAGGLMSVTGEAQHPHRVRSVGPLHLGEAIGRIQEDQMPYPVRRAQGVLQGDPGAVRVPAQVGLREVEAFEERVQPGHQVGSRTGVATGGRCGAARGAHQVDGVQPVDVGEFGGLPVPGGRGRASPARQQQEWRAVGRAADVHVRRAEGRGHGCGLGRCRPLGHDLVVGGEEAVHVVGSASAHGPTDQGCEESVKGARQGPRWRSSMCCPLWPWPWGGTAPGSPSATACNPPTCAR
ncbi:hypothetical protein GCM10011428_30440 [Streptomyces violaceus]